MESVRVSSGRVISLVGSDSGITANATGAWHYKDSPYSTFQGSVDGTGAVTATITIQASNDASHALATALGTITLSGTTTVCDGFTTTAPWKYVRAVVTNITGTGATVKVLMGV